MRHGCTVGISQGKFAVDRFHLVNKANEMVDVVRRRTTHTQRRRRGRKHDAQWINRR